MKKITILTAIILASFALFAQKDKKTDELKPFKVDVSLGYAIPMGGTKVEGAKTAKGGVLFVVEPKYAIMHNISVGLRLEGAALLKINENSDYDVKATSSYLATGDYYFMDNYSFRPFAGLGLGLYSLSSANSTAEGIVTSGTKFGQMVRAGFETGHFRLGIEYNLVPATKVAQVSSVSIGNSYLGIKFGVCFGGGRK